MPNADCRKPKTRHPWLAVATGPLSEFGFRNCIGIRISGFGFPLCAFACLISFLGSPLPAQDWSQWRGANRDGKVAGFVTPAPWPASLARQWQVTVGLGDATPALVGGQLYVFTRQGDEEVVRCLSAADGRELWRHACPAVPVTGPAESYPGPRSSPAVAAGRVLTLGVGGVLTCLEAATGKLAWRNNTFTNALPRFFTAMSPLVADGLCAVHVGGESNGTVVALEVATGKVNWKWTGEGPAYSSPVLMTVAGRKQLVVHTEKYLRGLAWDDGRPLWQVATSPKPGYWNSVTPVVDGDTVFYTGQGKGTRAVRIEKEADGFTAKEIWRNDQHGTVYTSPVLNAGQLYGVSDRGQFFCLNAQTGATVWAATNRVSYFTSLLDTGSALLALTEKTGLIAFQPGAGSYTELARWKVSDTPIYAHPVIAGTRIFIKDRETLTAWARE